MKKRLTIGLVVVVIVVFSSVSVLARLEMAEMLLSSNPAVIESWGYRIVSVDTEGFSVSYGGERVTPVFFSYYRSVAYNPKQSDVKKAFVLYFQKVHGSSVGPHEVNHIIFFEAGEFHRFVKQSNRYYKVPFGDLEQRDCLRCHSGDVRFEQFRPEVKEIPLPSSVPDDAVSNTG